jgi:glutaconate CoA-transferase, subunit A
MSVVMSAREAARLVEPGMRIAVGGLQGNHPTAMLRALLRAGTGDLDVVGPPVGMAPELLIAAGAVRRLAAPYMGAEGVLGVAPAYRAAVEAGTLDLWECDEALLLTALRAAAQDLPYLPWRGGVGTDVVRLNPDLREIADPASGMLLVRVPPLRPDVALLRALEADEHGNVRYDRHSAFADPALARASARVVVEVERLVDHAEVLAAPERTVLHRVDAVVVAPRGSYPFRAAGAIGQDDDWLREWGAAVRAALAAGQRLDTIEPLRAILDTPDDDAYLARVGGERLAALAALA